jgi:hypothetical protein
MEQHTACGLLTLPSKDDCFYASVFEAENPDLKEKPLAVQQKQIIVHLQLHPQLHPVLERVWMKTDRGTYRSLATTKPGEEGYANYNSSRMLVKYARM